MLLDHTSGLADFFFGKGVDAALMAERGATWTAGQALAYVGKPYSQARAARGTTRTPTTCSWGSSPRRSAGAPFATLVRDRLFGPAGLTDAFVQVAERPRGPLALGYYYNRPGPSARPIRPRRRRRTDRPVHLGRDRGRLGRGRRGDLGRSRRLGPGAVRRHDPQAGDAGARGRRREADGRLPPVRAVRARRPGHEHRRAPRARPQRAVHRRPRRASLPAQPGAGDRRPDEPERRRPPAADGEARRPGPADVRAAQPAARARPRGLSSRGDRPCGSGSACGGRGAGRPTRCRRARSRGSAAPGPSGRARSPRRPGTGWAS